MSSLEIVGLVAIILISAFAIIAIIISVPIFRLVNRIRLLADKLNISLTPMLEKINNTVAHLNGEINSISELTQSVGSIVEQLEKIVRLARIIFTSPIIKIISAGMGLASSVKKAASQGSKTEAGKTEMNEKNKEED